MSRVASWPAWTSSGRWGTRSIARIAVRATIRMPAATSSRRASLRVKWLVVAWRGVSIVASSALPSSVPADVVRREIGARERLRHELTDMLAVGPTARAWRKPAHDLAHVAGRRGTGRGHCLADEGFDLGIAQGRGQVLAED